MRTYDCDVCVVGSGAAGFAAALSASLTGKAVLLVEKESLFGGTTAYSAGAIWVPNSDHARSAGIRDSEERALLYLSSHVGTHLDRERADRFLKTAPQVLRIFEEQQFMRMRLVPNWPDYHPKDAGGVDGGRSLVPELFDGRELGEWFERLRSPLNTMMGLGGFMLDINDMSHVYRMRSSLRSAAYMGQLALRYLRDRIHHARGTRLAAGNALIGRLALHSLRRKIPIWLNTTAIELVKDSFRVTGVVVKKDNDRIHVSTRGGVVLAAGGYSRDFDRQLRTHQHLSMGKIHTPLPPEGNTGDGIRIAEHVGADFSDAGHHPAAWTPVSLVPQSDGRTIPFPHFIDRGKPGFISVDRRGNRFASESKSYHSFGAAMIEACHQHEEVGAWNICDHSTMRRFGIGAIGPAPTPTGKYLRSGYLKRASTLGELADACGIDRDGLIRTVRLFNQFAQAGVDADFQRGDDSYQAFNGLRSNVPNPCLAPIDRAPFYAVRMQLGELATFSGLTTNVDAQVLDKQNQIISGLYAAGNDAASFMGGTYPGSGINIASAVVFGHIAGQHASLGHCRSLLA